MFLEENYLIHAQQSGFSEKHSCETALTSLIDEWIASINNHNKVGTLFLDLSRITFKKAILVYKSIHNECPDYMSSLRHLRIYIVWLLGQSLKMQCQSLNQTMNF